MVSISLKIFQGTYFQSSGGVWSHKPHPIQGFSWKPHGSNFRCFPGNSPSELQHIRPQQHLKKSTPSGWGWTALGIKVVKTIVHWNREKWIMTLKRKVIKRPGWYVSFGLGGFRLLLVGWSWESWGWSWLWVVGLVLVAVGLGLLVGLGLVDWS